MEIPTPVCELVRNDSVVRGAHFPLQIPNLSACLSSAHIQKPFYPPAPYFINPIPHSCCLGMPFTNRPGGQDWDGLFRPFLLYFQSERGGTHNSSQAVARRAGSRVVTNLVCSRFCPFNCGMIAPGNHWDFDSLRAAPPARCRSMVRTDEFPVIAIK